MSEFYAAQRMAEVYGQEGAEEQVHGERHGAQGSSGSAWKELNEADSIMMVVQEGRSSEAGALSRSFRRGRLLREGQNQHERRSEGSAQSNETACDWEQRRKLHDHLQNVVLIMNFNWGWIARKSIDFWRRVYGPIFDNIVFVSKDALPDIGLEGMLSLTPAILHLGCSRGASCLRDRLVH